MKKFAMVLFAFALVLFMAGALQVTAQVVILSPVAVTTPEAVAEDGTVLTESAVLLNPTGVGRYAQLSASFSTPTSVAPTLLRSGILTGGSANGVIALTGGKDVPDAIPADAELVAVLAPPSGNWAIATTGQFQLVESVVQDRSLLVIQTGSDFDPAADVWGFWGTTAYLPLRPEDFTASTDPETGKVTLTVDLAVVRSLGIPTEAGPVVLTIAQEVGSTRACQRSLRTVVTQQRCREVASDSRSLDFVPVPR